MQNKSQYNKQALFSVNPQRFTVEPGTTFYSGDFNPYFLRNLSENTVAFLKEYDGMTLTKLAENGQKLQSIQINISEGIDLDVIPAQLGTERDILIWKDKQHWKNQIEGGKVYHDDWLFTFYDKLISEKPIIRKAKFKFDFKNRLNPSNLRQLFTILIIDELGYQSEKA